MPRTVYRDQIRSQREALSLSPGDVVIIRGDVEGRGMDDMIGIITASPRVIVEQYYNNSVESVVAPSIWMNEREPLREHNVILHHNP